MIFGLMTPAPMLRSTVQTIVRRLAQSQTKDHTLNPFIEKSPEGAVTGHSVASTTPYSASPKPRVLPGDVVIPDADRETGEEPLPESFLEALGRTLGLQDADMDVLRATDPDHASPFVANTLCAVRAVCSEPLFVLLTGAASLCDFLVFELRALFRRLLRWAWSLFSPAL